LRLRSRSGRFVCWGWVFWGGLGWSGVGVGVGIAVCGGIRRRGRRRGIRRVRRVESTGLPVGEFGLQTCCCV
jgi:hypothetical protein